MEIIVGYDPGGNNDHGWAELRTANGEVSEISTDTLDSAEDVIRRLERLPNLTALGIDTLTCWATGPSAWRPADRWLREWLREHCEPVRNSVMSPNSLSGSMGLNGMAVLLSVRRVFPNSLITETHPKVLYYALSKVKYDYKNQKAQMDDFLDSNLGLRCRCEDDHQFDAAMSAFAAFAGSSGRWTRDLHKLPCIEDERVIEPCGSARYFWPS